MKRKNSVISQQSETKFIIIYTFSLLCHIGERLRQIYKYVSEVITCLLCPSFIQR